ncbi:MAG: nucleoside deaminase [Anaerolineae bacterium]
MISADLRFLRLAIQVAGRAREHGNHPFGAVLVGADGALLLEAENTVVTEQDVTGHAETNLVRLASRRYSRDFLAGCTLFTSTEPCAMCAGAIYWSNIGRVVFGLSEAGLARLTGHDPENPTLHLPCRELFARGRRTIEVVGPALEQQAEEVHHGFWKPGA